MLPASVVTARNASCAVAPSPTPAIELINAPRYGGFGAALKGADWRAISRSNSVFSVSEVFALTLSKLFIFPPSFSNCLNSILASTGKALKF